MYGRIYLDRARSNGCNTVIVLNHTLIYPCAPLLDNSDITYSSGRLNDVDYQPGLPVSARFLLFDQCNNVELLGIIYAFATDDPGHRYRWGAQHYWLISAHIAAAKEDMV